MNALYLNLHNEPDFLPVAFNHAWLNSLHITQMHVPNTEIATYLHGIDNASLDYLFISEQVALLTTRPAVRNWLRVLRPNGKLIFANTPKSFPIISSALAYAMPLVHAIDDYSSPHFIRWQKSESIPPLSLLVQQTLNLQHGNHVDEALSMAQLTILAYPDQIHSYQHLTLYYERLGWLHKLDELWQIAVTQLRTPAPEMLQFMSLLQRGDYVRGFELRKQYCNKYMPKQRRSHAYPAPHDKDDHRFWQGESLQGKTLVVWSEFGLGDEIMFIQLAYYLKQVVGVVKLIWVVQPPIVSLVQTNPFIDEVVNAKVAADTLAEFDYWTFPHDLLVYLKQPFEQMPKHYPYLSPQADKLAYFAERTRTNKPVKVGIAWRGDPTHENDHFRSIHNVNELDTLLEASPNIQFFCIQKELNDTERDWLHKNNIPYFGDELRDFADTAALLANMDVVITVDTSIVHVAGALNLRTCVLLPYVYDWRWGLPSKQNLWYPNTFKFQISDLLSPWTQPLQKLRDTLREFAEK